MTTQQSSCTPVDVTAWLESENRFATDDSGRLYIYKGGVYVPGADRIVKGLILGFFEENGRSDEWSQGKSADILARVRIKAKELWVTPPSDVLNVQNGLLDIKALKLSEHAPEHLSTLQLPVRYDPQATCPAWDEFVSGVMPDCEDLLWETVGFTLVPESPIQKTLLLYGPGGNGKSTLLSAVTALIGSNNVSNVTLQDLAGDNFASAELFGKLANIFADLPAKDIGDTSLLKALTGGDEISAQFKFKDRFKFKPPAKLIFSANQLPRVTDTSVGFWDRVQIVPMEQRVRATEAEIPQSELMARLRDPAELSGAFNKALEGRERLNSNRGFSESARSRELKDEMRKKLSPVAEFLRDETQEISTGQIESQVLLEHFNAWARDNDHPEKTPSHFGKLLKKLRPKVETARQGPRGDPRSVYQGLALKDTA